MNIVNMNADSTNEFIELVLRAMKYNRCDMEKTELLIEDIKFHPIEGKHELGKETLDQCVFYIKEIQRIQKQIWANLKDLSIEKKCFYHRKKDME